LDASADENFASVHQPEPKSSIKAAFEANSLLLHCFISSALMRQTMLECSATHP
jgi:hypothetical protein